MPGETTRLKLKFAEEKDERASYPTSVDEPRAELLDTIMVASVKPSIIATEQSRENTAYGTLATADEVTVVLPENGLIAVAYQATWGTSVASAGSAAIFIGSNQLQRANAVTRSPQAALGTEGTNSELSLFTTGFGLTSPTGTGKYLGDVTTGQLVGGYSGSAQEGGVCYIFAAAGTYKVTVQFKATSGKVTAKNRKLWAWVVGA